MNHVSGYDVVVYGSGLKHLIISALLAARRVNLLVLSVPDDNRFKKDGYQFPCKDPLLLDFNQEGAFGEILSEIHLPILNLKGEEQLFKGLSPFLQTVFPDYRIDIFQEEAELLDELCRELKDERDLIISFFEKASRINSLISEDYTGSSFIKLKGLIKRASLSGKKGIYLFKGYNPSMRFIRLFDLLSMALFGVGIEEIDALRLLSILRMLKGGGRSVRGGIEILADLLVKKIRSEGGEFYNGDIDEFRIKRNRITGIKTSRGDLFDCKAVVMESQKAKEDLQINRFKRFSFYFGADADFIPSPMADYLLLTRDYSKGIQADNLLMLSLSPSGDLRWAPADKRLITVSTLIPSSQILSGSYLDGLKDSVLDNLIWLMPFSDSHIDFIGDGRLFDKSKEIERSPLLSLSALPKNLYLIRDNRYAWIRTSEELASSYRIASQISEKI